MPVKPISFRRKAAPVMLRKIPEEVIDMPEILVVALRASEALPYKVKHNALHMAGRIPYAKHGIVSCPCCGTLTSSDEKNCSVCGEQQFS